MLVFDLSRPETFHSVLKVRRGGGGGGWGRIMSVNARTSVIIVC